MKCLLVWVAVLAMSCSINKGIRKEKNTIPFIFQDNVEEALQKEINRVGSNVYFELSHINNDTFDIVVVNLSEPHMFVSFTKRKVLIGKQLYPLLFDHDFLFAPYETGADILKKVRTEKYLTTTHRFVLNHHLYRVVFIRRGEIISQGYDKI